MFHFIWVLTIRFLKHVQWQVTENIKKLASFLIYSFLPFHFIYKLSDRTLQTWFTLLSSMQSFWSGLQALLRQQPLALKFWRTVQGVAVVCWEWSWWLWFFLFFILWQCSLWSGSCPQFNVFCLKNETKPDLFAWAYWDLFIYLLI